MDSTKSADENWQVLLRFLPRQWKRQARLLGALKRQRKVDTPEKLLRLLMMHLADGCSLKETVTRAEAGNLAHISAVALMKRLRSSAEWLRWVAVSLLKRRGLPVEKPEWLHDYNVRTVDASVINEPGSRGTDWRLHYGLQLFGLHCDAFNITRPDVGESFTNFAVSGGDLLIGDRAYCGLRGMHYVKKCQGEFIVRYRHRSCGLQERDGSDFALLKELSSLGVGQVGEWQLFITGAKYKPLLIRLCAIRKSEEAAKRAIENALKQASKKQKTVSPETLELQRYVILLGSLARNVISPNHVMEIYRCRWQVELAFKRLKSIMGLGHLPKKDLESAKAWLHGKIVVALLVQAIVDEGRFFSPWGYPL